MLNKEELKKDLYNEVNKEWLETAKIPHGHTSISAFMELHEKTYETLINDVDDMIDGKINVSDTRMQEFLKLYKLALDVDRKDKEGINPLKERLRFIENIKSYDDINKDILNCDLENIFPFNFSVYDDMKNSKIHAIYLDSPSTILPDKDYYKDERKDKLLKVYEEVMVKILNFEYDLEKSKDLVKKAIEFDASFVPYLKSSEENANITAIYNPRTIEEIKNYSNYLNIDKMAKTIFSDDVENIIVTEPKYFENINEFLNDETFEKYKAWLIVKIMQASSTSLTEEIRFIAHEFTKAINGVEESQKLKKFFYEQTKSMFSEVIGNYYAQKYFGKEAKEDVKKMVFNFIDVYKERLAKNTWLKQETIKKAIDKLNKFDVLIGYPDKIKEVYDRLKVDESLSYYENIRNISIEFKKENYSKYKKEVNKKEWGMSADTVNAYYSPQKNLICFPAAILQEPFYSLNQSPSNNYGGIGTVIAHEISHAFDNNGSQIDEDGNLNNWWDKEDFEKFDNLCKKMIKQFDGLEIGDGKVNGTLTVSENIADNGGLSCSLEALKKLDKYNLEEFFLNWARIWRNKMTKEYQNLLLSCDVHSPAKLRANMQVKNIDEFYEVFDINENDPMYLRKEERIIIW